MSQCQQIPAVTWSKHYSSTKTIN